MYIVIGAIHEVSIYLKFMLTKHDEIKALSDILHQVIFGWRNPPIPESIKMSQFSFDKKNI